MSSVHLDRGCAVSCRRRASGVECVVLYCSRGFSWGRSQTHSRRCAQSRAMVLCVLWAPFSAVACDTGTVWPRAHCPTAKSVFENGCRCGYPRRISETGGRPVCPLDIERSGAPESLCLCQPKHDDLSPWRKRGKMAGCSCSYPGAGRRAPTIVRAPYGGKCGSYSMGRRPVFGVYHAPSYASCAYHAKEEIKWL